MAVQDYELLLRVRADMLQAISGLDSVRKKLDDTGKQAKDMGDKAGKAVDGMSSKFGSLKQLIAGLAIGAGIRAVFAAVQESQDAVAQLDARLKSTGSAAGFTRDQLIDLSGQMQNLTTFGDEAVLSMETLLLTFTNIRGPVFRDATKVVLDMSVALGQDLKTSATQVGKALNDPILGMTALSKVGVNFTDTQKSVIKSLVDTGQIEAAQSVILRELQTEYGGAAEAAANTFGGALAQLKNAAGDLLEGDGGNLNDATSSVKELARTLQDPEIKAGFATLVDGLIGIAGQAAKAAAAFAGFGRAVADFFRDNADKSYMGLLQERLRISEKIASLQANPIASKFGWNKGDIADLQGQLAEVDKLIIARNAANQKSAAPPVTPVPPPRTTAPKPPEIKKAVDDTAKYIAAAGALQTQLQSLQSALDPTAAAWNTYAQAVEKANTSAELAKKAPGANAAALDAYRDSVIALAAAQRDAALDKIADADREAWVKLRDSLRTPLEVATDNAAAQIKQLNVLMAKGVLSSDDYHAAVKKIGEGSVTAAPQYQGVDAAVSGPAGELAKNFDASDKLDKWYEEQQKANDAFRAQDLANEEAYQARKAAIDAQYSDQRQKIEAGRQQLTLATTSDFLGNLAELQHSSNKKVAKVGKAAAIAKAIIDTYAAATAAFKAMAGIPVVGPALGTAAAAAAIATGLANVASIRSTPDGYDQGGYTGPGRRLQPAGIVHRGEVVWSQRDIARAGGVSVVEALRLGYPGFVDGGVVGNLEAGMQLSPSSGSSPSQAAPAPQDVKVVVVMDRDAMAEEIMNSPAGQKVIVQTAGDNPRSIQARWGR